ASLRQAATGILAQQAWAFAAVVLLDLAEVAAESRDAEVAAWAATRLDDVAGRVERDLYRALAAIGRAWSALAAGSPNSAAGAAQAALTLLSGTGYRAFLGRALDVLGRSLAPADRA